MSELAVAHAARIKLPESYEAAKKAIAQCAELDECAHWIDKAAAMAACARIAEDDAMLKDAMRIQARAVRQLGELIKLVPTAQGQRSELHVGGCQEVASQASNRRSWYLRAPGHDRAARCQRTPRNL